MGDHVTATGGPRRSDTVLVVGIITLGICLRLLYLGAPSFWVDEALSVAFARLSWPQFMHLMVTRELNMLPYYLVLRAWIHFGTEEWIVRSLSAICSIATLPLFYRLGVRLFGVRVGQIGVALLALHPYHIRFAQEARGYSMMLLLVTGSTLLLVRATESSSRRPVSVWVAYVATSVLAVYTHFYASLAILAQWASLAVARPRGLPSRAFALSVAAIGILLLPLAAFVLLGHADPAGWIPHPTFRRVEYLVYSLLGGDNGSGAREFAYPAYAAALFASGASARAAWRTHRREPYAWHYALVIAGATLPIILVLAASLVKPIFVDKYLIECLPFTVLLVAVGMDRLRPRALSLGALIVTLVLSVHAVVGYYRRSDKDDWRAATGYVLASARPGDAALFFPRFVVAPFDYYRASFDTTANAVAVIYPGTLGDGDVSDALSRLQHRYGRLWAVFNQDGDAGTAVRDSLLRRYPIVSDRQFTGVRVVLYDTR
jgi:mannosyltransferase